MEHAVKDLFPLNCHKTSFRTLTVCRHVLVRGVSLLGSIFAEALLGCTHLYSLLSTLLVLTPRGVVTRPPGSSHSRRSVMGSITHSFEVSTEEPLVLITSGSHRAVRIVDKRTYR